MCDTTDNGDGRDDDEDIFFNDCESIESITLSEIDGDHMDDEFDLKTPFSLEYQFYEWLEQFDNNEDTEIEFSAEIYDWDLDFNEDMDVEHHTIEFSAELYEWDFDDFEDNKEDFQNSVFRTSLIFNNATSGQLVFKDQIIDPVNIEFNN